MRDLKTFFISSIDMIKQLKEWISELPFEVRFILAIPLVLASLYFTIEMIGYFAMLFYPHFGHGAGIFVFLVIIFVLAALKKR